jgi:hypothetical protein
MKRKLLLREAVIALSVLFVCLFGWFVYWLVGGSGF